MSSSLTVGFVLASELSISPYKDNTNSEKFIMEIIKRIITNVTGGSKSFSPSTSIQVISIAPFSPGEHGVRRSSTI